MKMGTKCTVRCGVKSNCIDLEYLYSLLTIPLANYQVYAYLKD